MASFQLLLLYRRRQRQAGARTPHHMTRLPLQPCQPQDRRCTDRYTRVTKHTDCRDFTPSPTDPPVQLPSPIAAQRPPSRAFVPAHSPGPYPCRHVSLSLFSLLSLIHSHTPCAFESVSLSETPSHTRTPYNENPQYGLQGHRYPETSTLKLNHKSH